MGAIGDVVNLAMLVAVVGGIGYLAYDLKTNDCDSLLGTFLPRCAVNTAKNIVTGTVHEVVDLGKDVGHEVANVGREIGNLFGL
jgi:hypothetical protein